MACLSAAVAVSSLPIYTSVLAGCYMLLYPLLNRPSATMPTAVNIRVCWGVLVVNVENNIDSLKVQDSIYSTM